MKWNSTGCSALLFTTVLTACFPTDLHRRATGSSSSAGSAASGTELDQEMEVLYCVGFCAMAEVGSEAETETIKRVLQKVEAIQEVEAEQTEAVQEAVEQIDDIDRRVEKVRELDEALYGDDPNLRDVVD